MSRSQRRTGSPTSTSGRSTITQPPALQNVETPDVYLVPPDSGEIERARVASAASRHRLTERSDIVWVKDKFALSITTTTPHEAMVEDLLFVRDVLDATAIEYLLVRGNDERPVIAIDRHDRPTLRDALVAACADEPFYSKPMDVKGSPALLIADGLLASATQARIFRLFRPRAHRPSGLFYGSGKGIQIELWEFSDDTIVLPVENSLTRRTIRQDEAVRGTVERFGRHWPTIENMFADHASDIDFDIDLIFSWVDGTDVEWQAERAAMLREVVVGEGDDHEARFRQIDELKYALRSVHLYAPWIRRIFVVTDSPKPGWLDDHPDVTFVRSEEFFTDTSVLPTYNSQAVECQLHHIDGLAEHFLYSNDDMFFGRPVGPQMFFSPGGISMFVEAGTRIGLGSNDEQRSGFENAARVNRRLLHDRFGRITTRHLEHAPVPLRRSVMFELEKEFPDEFAATAASRFRASSNISVTNSLYHYYALLTGRAVVQTQASVKYVDTTMRSGLRDMDRLLAKRSMDFFCLNDGSFPEIDADERAAAVTTFLSTYFPVPAPWEQAVTPAG
ncbi:stealth conserved region 3 domain-containing protein [Rhodococcus sp. BP-349]|nr:stealth conserved region 3 domain-containing protein [Rhodococcus sp. BP-363]MBY6544380.1 stealth conserved region 3 domain-containing protein [Rhodococcus sp. BP-369]MBY6563610.1 stealth conserved region 3 domain-containing protein [Rhodococcus sp. BP-370]MBY6577902.1 stealth conserved region 3 domain-containing protein [Rhodococcus sp. BP-364]MBY6587203.1 stealth conserved region 3 domain-containing protein [Rhodococcus sp. BP-358]MBY6591540.1 stealth conserved region 3 domain-containing 